MLAAMDDAVVRNDTLFVFSSDTGDPQPGVVTENGQWLASKGTLYECGVRVTAFATWDGKIKARSTVAEPLHVVDWYPTLFKMGGATAEQKLPVDGRDTWPTLTEGKPSPPDAILLNTMLNTGGRPRRRLEVGTEEPHRRPARRADQPTERPRQRKGEVVQLEGRPSREDDPREKTNLADENPDKVKELRSRLVRFAKHAVAPKAKPAGFTTPKLRGREGLSDIPPGVRCPASAFDRGPPSAGVRVASPVKPAAAPHPLRSGATPTWIKESDTNVAGGSPAPGRRHRSFESDRRPTPNGRLGGRRPRPRPPGRGPSVADAHRGRLDWRW